MTIDTTTPVSKIRYKATANSEAVEIPLYAEKAIIRVAELSGVALEITKGSTSIDYRTSSGEVIDFEVDSIGTYMIRASVLDQTLWQRTVEITELNTINIVKAGDLANYSEAQIQQACVAGIAHIMWSVGDQWTFPTITGNLVSGQKIFITEFFDNNGKDEIEWTMADGLGSSAYDIYPQFYYLANASATSWSSSYRSLGGMKYSAMEQRCKEHGETIYSQTTGILPDDYAGTLTDGIKFSELYYTDGGGAKSSIYSYSTSTDTFTILSAPNYSTTPMFVKGYFTSVGQIDETTFNAGYYYTYANGRYTRATTYVSGTTYYGFYETLQADGIFCSTIKETGFASYLVKKERFASAGGPQTASLSSFTDYINLPAIEEITGLYRGMTLPSGRQSIYANAYNLAGEGTKRAGFDFDTQTVGRDYWSRSTYSSSSNSFCNINTSGYIGTYGVNGVYAVRLSFITGFQNKYTITGSITNGTLLTPANIVEGETMTVRIRPNANYTYPNSITVSGASYTYDNTNGEIILSNATGNVSITATCQSPGLSAYATAQSGVIYTAVSDLSNYTDAYINEISKAISNCADITNATQTIYLSDETSISIGATRSYTLSTQEAMTDRILGFNHDDLTNANAYGEATATGKAGITWQMVKCLATRYSMNSSATNAGGWNSCVMRTSTLPTIKALLPSDLQSVIKLVDKKAANGGSSNYSATVTSSDDLFLLAEIEIFGFVSYAQDGANEGTQYAHWASHNQASDRIKHYDNAGTPTATYWWERSSGYYSTDYFCNVDNDGNANSGTANYSRGVAFAYCT